MKDEIILYQPNEQFQLEVQLKDDTVWLTQEQIAMLFGTQRPAITKHLNNIYASGELNFESTCSILERMGNDGKQRYQTKYYNLDAILSVGYRVNNNAQYAPIDVKQFDRAHDRFLCIDETVYHIGASLKDLGKKLFAFGRMEMTTSELINKM